MTSTHTVLLELIRYLDNALIEVEHFLDILDKMEPSYLYTLKEIDAESKSVGYDEEESTLYMYLYTDIQRLISILSSVRYVERYIHMGAEPIPPSAGFSFDRITSSLFYKYDPEFREIVKSYETFLTSQAIESYIHDTVMNLFREDVIYVERIEDPIIRNIYNKIYRGIQDNKSFKFFRSQYTTLDFLRNQGFQRFTALYNKTNGYLMYFLNIDML